MVSPCAVCASLGKACCKGYQIYLTPGDVSRISDYLNSSDFYTVEPPVLSDIEPDYDPLWLPMIMSEDRQVRVLKRGADKQCSLATDKGCQLPLDRRPLVCRLFPYYYLEDGILGIDAACPISNDCNWRTVLNRMDMDEVKAKSWVDLLYKEIRNKKEAICLTSV